MPRTDSHPQVTPAGDARVAEFDGLRGIAVTAAVISHLVAYRPRGGWLDTPFVQSAAYGWLGVDLFFVLSGYLITGILIDTRNDERWWTNFTARRALRILPPYVLVLLAVRALGPAAGITTRTELIERGLWYVAFAGNQAFAAGREIAPFSHLWSVAVEEQFYLVWPLIVAVAPGRALVIVSAALFAFGPLYRAIAVFDGSWPVGSAYRVAFGRIDGLAAGAAVAAVLRDPFWCAALRPRGPALAVTGLLLYVWLWERFGLAMHEPVPQLWIHTFAAAAFAGVLVTAIDGAGGASLYARLLRNGVLRRVGALSYGIYLYHFPIHLALGAAAGASADAPYTSTGAFALHVAAVCGLTSAAARASERFVERPILALKRLFAYRNGARDPSLRA